MDDILASIRKIIAEEPIGSRSIPGALHDGPPGSTHPVPPKTADRVALGPSRPFAKDPVLPMPPANGPVAGHATSLDDDLFEPELPQSTYVTPQPPRDLIFTPTPFTETPAPPAPPVFEAVAPPQLPEPEPDVAAAAAADGVHDAPMPSLDEIAAALKLKPAAEAAALAEPGPVGAEIAEETAPSVPTSEPDQPASALDTSVEDLLGALAAGLAQHVPQTADKSAETTAVTEDDARKAVADAIAAVTASNVPPVAEVIVEEAAAAVAIEAPIAPSIEPRDAQFVEPMLAVTTIADTIAAVPVTEVSGASAAVHDLEPSAKDVEVPRAVEATAAAAAAAAVAAAAHAASIQPASADVVEAPPSTEPHQAKSFEDAVSAMLRPLIKDWLDRHMPDLVAKALDAELKSRLPR